MIRSRNDRLDRHGFSCVLHVVLYITPLGVQVFVQGKPKRRTQNETRHGRWCENLKAEEKNSPIAQLVRALH